MLDLNKIFILQTELDSHIHKEHKVSYAKIRTELKLALIVELAETANEIRSFKFWSYKQPSEKNVILEEYADGIHFITSLCIYYKAKPLFYLKKVKSFKSKQQITKSFIKLFEQAAKIDNSLDAKKWYTNYLEFGLKMGFDIDEIISAYEAKCKINHQRQNTRY